MSVPAEPEQMIDESAVVALVAMDHRADQVIKNWSFGSLAANLLPPPFDSVLVAAAFARMGATLATVYEVKVTRREMKGLARAIAKGITGVGLASKVGTDLFKWVPGVNIWVALLIQPPIVAAIGYSVGHAFKNYFRLRHAGQQELSPELLRLITEQAASSLESRLGK